MRSLRELLASHAPLLLVDTASTVVHAGVVTPGTTTWESAAGEAGVELFSCVERVLSRAGFKLSQINAFVFCEGPGSVLGIRTAAVALRTWQAVRERPVFSYQSLALVAEHLAAEGDGKSFSVIADARREMWHRVRFDPVGRVGPLERVAAAALNGELCLPEGFRHWSALPAGVKLVPYPLAPVLSNRLETALFRAVLEPDAFLHEEPSYRTWTPQIHQAPL